MAANSDNALQVIQMTIAIVDDQAEDLRDTENFLREYLAEHFAEVAPTVQIRTFDDAEKFLSKFRSDAFDLLILDIVMEPLNGIQVAKIVRNQDRDVPIIFLTSSDDFMLAGYEVFAVGYILKPLTENTDRFAKTFAHVFPRLIDNQKRLTVPIKGGEISVAYRDIRYVDIDERHRLCIHVASKKFPTTMTYEEIFNLLKDDARFLECYHRILVNMDAVKRMDGEDFVLSDGARVPISRRKNKSAKLKYMEHLIAVSSTNIW